MSAAIELIVTSPADGRPDETHHCLLRQKLQAKETGSTANEFPRLSNQSWKLALSYTLFHRFVKGFAETVQ
jgi:hypothetical protein